MSISELRRFESSDSPPSARRASRRPASPLRRAHPEARAIVGVAALLLLALPLTGQSCATTSWEEDRGIPFSPDDRAVAYQHRGSIYIARTQGDAHHQIYAAEGAGAVVGSPRWAPDQRAVAFAVSGGEPDETGRVPYTVWFWPAPQAIWESVREGSQSDTATLPTRWSPADPRKIVEAHSLASVQVRAGAVIEWHPDGESILFLDTDDAQRQSVRSVEVGTGATSEASPIRAANLAFGVSPDGHHLLCAAEDPELDRSGLWLGPMGSGPDAWQRIEPRPGPRSVPSLSLEAKPGEENGRLLLDLRPRLGAWSARSTQLAYIRLAAGSDGEPEEDSVEPTHWLVISPVPARGEPHLIALSGAVPHDLHWSKDGVRVGFLANRELVVVDGASGEAIRLGGVQRVEDFIGWSATGDRMAYLTPADQFPAAYAMLPSGTILIWQPAQRHNLVVAREDGTTPESRFSGMQINAARWAHAKPKLSFWATYLPTVTDLAPGDPAAVLDVEDGTLSWYPTDVFEYAQVGHYYLLNGRCREAADFYGDALEGLGDEEDEADLSAQLHLWRGISRLQLGNGRGAAADLSYFREHLRSSADAELQEAAREERPPADWAGRPDLEADRILLSTLLSMNQVPLAAQEARSMTEDLEPARSVQAHAFLALIEQATGDVDRFAERMVENVLPGILALEEANPERIEEVVGANLEILTADEMVRLLSEETGRKTLRALLDLSASASPSHPEAARDLALGASLLARDYRDVASELEALRLLASIDETIQRDSN
jgi:hypothetical protein